MSSNIKSSSCKSVQQVRFTRWLATNYAYHLEWTSFQVLENIFKVSKSYIFNAFLNQIVVILVNKSAEFVIIIAAIF